MNLIDDFLDNIPTASPEPVRWAKVTTASPLAVRFAGDSASVRITLKLDAYTPVLNDITGLVRFGSKWVAVGKIGAA